MRTKCRHVYVLSKHWYTKFTYVMKNVVFTRLYSIFCLCYVTAKLTVLSCASYDLQSIFQQDQRYLWKLYKLERSFQKQNKYLLPLWLLHMHVHGHISYDPQPLMVADWETFTPAQKHIHCCFNSFQNGKNKQIL